ncbi:MAG: IclR family transcriptional regulator [Armatimonadota bacterium]|nr:IclR family transcriptional regulator [Armatimonadota bacterium]
MSTLRDTQAVARTGRRAGAVQSVRRVVDLLAALGDAPGPLSIRELSAAVGLPRPTVYRLMQTLTACGMAAPGEGGFVIGPRVLALAAGRLEQIELRGAGRPYLAALVAQTGETAHLAVLEQGQVVYIDKVEGPGPLRMASAVGKIMPAHSTALGKAMLAALPPDEAARILRTTGLPRRTPATITDPDRFAEELAAVRGRGFAIDNIENEEGIRCVGAAIRDHRGLLAGAVSLSGAASSITLERARRELGPLVRQTALAISRALGWPGAEEGST